MNPIEATRSVSILPVFHDAEYLQTISSGLERVVRERASQVSGRIIIGIENASFSPTMAANILRLQLQNIPFSPSQAFYFASARGEVAIEPNTYNPNETNIQTLIDMTRLPLVRNRDGQFYDAILMTLDRLNTESQTKGRILFVMEDAEDLLTRESDSIVRDQMSTAAAEEVNRGNWRSGSAIMLNYAYTRKKIDDEREGRMGAMLLDAMDETHANAAILLAGSTHRIGVERAVNVLTIDRKTRRGNYPNINSEALNVYKSPIPNTYIERLTEHINSLHQGESASTLLVKLALIERFLTFALIRRASSIAHFDSLGFVRAVTQLVETIRNETEAERFLNDIKPGESFDRVFKRHFHQGDADKFVRQFILK
ncbi:MAG: hypothetical protein ACREGI_02650 [Candidatus Levyibacteriota bacterium]